MNLDVKCDGCKKLFDKNEIDDSGVCFDCANFDPDPKPDLISITVLAARRAYEALVKRIGRKFGGESN